MGGHDEARAERNRAADDPGYVQLLEEQAHTDDVVDGIHGPGFVEVHLLDWLSVHACFGGTQVLEYVPCPRADPLGQFGTVDESQDRWEGSFRLSGEVGL